MKKARVNRAQYHNRQLLNRQPLTRSKFFFALFCLLDPFSGKRCASPAELFARCGLRLPWPWLSLTSPRIDARMSSGQIAVILKRFESPDEVRVLQKGRFELVHLGGMTIGRATYEPGWKWSEHVGPGVGVTRCNIEHVGLVLSGTATVAFDSGSVFELRAGELFYVPPIPHDSWVVGDEPYVSLHFLGADYYATRRTQPRRSS
jgi:quercetin dioxygenase-like cupin family protein